MGRLKYSYEHIFIISLYLPRPSESDGRFSSNIGTLNLNRDAAASQRHKAARKQKNVSSVNVKQFVAVGGPGLKYLNWTWNGAMCACFKICVCPAGSCTAPGQVFSRM